MKRKLIAFIVASVAISLVIVGGFLMNNLILGFSGATEAPEEKKIMMRGEGYIIFENGTKVHWGPFEIPCHVEEITERGWVVVPDYPVPSYNSNTTKDSTDSNPVITIMWRWIWTDLEPRTWIYLQAYYGYTFSTIPILATAELYSWADYGHVEDKYNPHTTPGIYRDYFWYRTQSGDLGYAGVDFYATGEE